jgi:excinuclease ABC subunit B
MGRAARNINGRVILYADRMTRSMSEAIAETERRRAIQAEFNRLNGIEPRSAKRSEQRSLSEGAEQVGVGESGVSYGGISGESLPEDPREQAKLIEQLKKEMFDAAAKREYELAAQLRDRIQGILKRAVREG